MGVTKRKGDTIETKDLREFFARKLEEYKEKWLNDITEIINAPLGYQLKILPPEVVESDNQNALPIRKTDNPNAPVYKKKLMLKK